MSIKNKLKWMIPGSLMRIVSAFDNSSVTEGYLKARSGDIWGAWQFPFTQAMGSWFHGGLIFLPAVSMFIHQRSLNISAMWLLCALVAYGSSVADLPGFVFYLFIVAWIAFGLIKLLAIKYHA